METKFGFKKFNLSEFEEWLKSLRVSRTILKLQHHHTYVPAYVHFNGKNHFERQKAMKDYHVNQNGWSDIGQHFTIFPDGTILTGRNIESSPACIYGQNAHSICIENFGNFDKNKDKMTLEQQHSIVRVTALFCLKFNIPASTDYIVYHHWFNLSTGERNNGAKNNKSCPGTNFFGGNKVVDCQTNFIPLVEKEIRSDVKSDLSNIEKYVIVNIDVLNIRTQPTSSSSKAPERSSALFGSILRVYAEQNGWLKISKSESRWVSSKYTAVVQRVTVNASVLNVRTGPGTSFPKSGSLTKGEILFITEINQGWCKLGLEEKWVSKQYLTS